MSTSNDKNKTTQLRPNYTRQSGGIGKASRPPSTASTDPTSKKPPNPQGRRRNEGGSYSGGGSSGQAVGRQTYRQDTSKYRESQVSYHGGRGHYGSRYTSSEKKLDSTTFTKSSYSNRTRKAFNSTSRSGKVAGESLEQNSRTTLPKNEPETVDLDSKQNHSSSASSHSTKEGEIQERHAKVSEKKTKLNSVEQSVSEVKGNEKLCEEDLKDVTGILESHDSHMTNETEGSVKTDESVNKKDFIQYSREVLLSLKMAPKSTEISETTKQKLDHLGIVRGSDSKGTKESLRNAHRQNLGDGWRVVEVNGKRRDARTQLDAFDDGEADNQRISKSTFRENSSHSWRDFDGDKYNSSGYNKQTYSLDEDQPEWMAFEVDDNEEMFEFGSCEEIEKLREELKDQGNNKAVPKESDEESSLKAATEQEDELEAAPRSEDGSDELKNNEEEKGGELKRKENDDKIDLDLNKFLGFQIDDDEDSDNENRLRQKVDVTDATRFPANSQDHTAQVAEVEKRRTSHVSAVDPSAVLKEVLKIPVQTNRKEGDVPAPSPKDTPTEATAKKAATSYHTLKDIEGGGSPLHPESEGSLSDDILSLLNKELAVSSQHYHQPAGPKRYQNIQSGVGKTPVEIQGGVSPITYPPSHTGYSQSITQPSTHMGQTSTHMGQPSTHIGHLSTYMGQPSTHIGHLSTYMGQPSTHMGQPSTHMGQPSTHMGQPSTHMGQSSTHMGQPSTHIGQSSTHMGQLSTHIGQSSTHMGQPSTHIGQPSTHIGHLSTYMGQPSTHMGQQSTHIGQLSTHMGQPSTHMGQPSTHMGQPSTHIGQLSTHMGQPSTHMGQPSTHLRDRGQPSNDVHDTMLASLQHQQHHHNHHHPLYPMRYEQNRVSHPYTGLQQQPSQKKMSTFMPTQVMKKMATSQQQQLSAMPSSKAIERPGPAHQHSAQFLGAAAQANAAKLEQDLSNKAAETLNWMFDTMSSSNDSHLNRAYPQEAMIRSTASSAMDPHHSSYYDTGRPMYYTSQTLSDRYHQTSGWDTSPR